MKFLLLSLLTILALVEGAKAEENVSADISYFKTKMEAYKKTHSPDIKPISTKVKAMFMELLSRRYNRTSKGIMEANANSTSELFQGDIVLTRHQADLLLSGDSPSKRQAIRTNVTSIWDKGFFYSFHPNFPEHHKTVVKLAIGYWHNNTCINFAQSDTEPNRVRFEVTDKGCWSMYGRVGGVQSLSIGNNCDTVGISAHEIGHALGLFHEHIRPDRDAFVSINTANMQKGQEYNMNRENTGRSEDYKMPYDYGSVMHYSSNTFAASATPVMIASNPLYQDGMGTHMMSFRDFKLVNKCMEKCSAAQHSACSANGGYAHPRNCKKCVFPPGTADASYVNSAPVGKRVVATITNHNEWHCYRGCVVGGFEFKWRNDLTVAGSRHCCPADLNKPLTTESSNILPIIAFNRQGRQAITIKYKFI